VRASWSLCGRLLDHRAYSRFSSVACVANPLLTLDPCFRLMVFVRSGYLESLRYILINWNYCPHT
jgi:hypothetical protein